MELVIDPDVARVIEFMDRGIRASANRCYIAKSIAAIAPIIWPERKEVPAIALPPILLKFSTPATVQESDHSMPEPAVTTE